MKNTTAMVAATLALGGCAAIENFLAPLGPGEQDKQVQAVVPQERLPVVEARVRELGRHD